MTSDKQIEVLLEAIQHLAQEVAGLRKQTGKVVYTNKEMMELLDASSATLKKWRDLGYLSYSIVGASYYYSQKDLADFLTTHHFDAFA